MNENIGTNDKEIIEILNAKLKSTEERLNKILKLVHKTFTGNSAAAQELSDIVGVTAPILCSEDDDNFQKPEHVQKYTNKPSYPETNSRLAGRMEFLNQVMDDHDKMMKQNYQRSPNNKSSTNHNNSVRNRARSADRTSTGPDHIFFNPYTWNLNDHAEFNDSNLYKNELSSSSALCQTKPLLCKSAKSRPQTRLNNFSDMKIEHLLYNSENRRSLKSNSCVVPDTRDYKLTCERDINLDKPPKSVRPTSSISHKRNASARIKRKSNMQSPFHNLNLQSMDESNGNTEKLLDAMEKRFQLSTIDLQRRLGIPEAGMVGP